MYKLEAKRGREKVKQIIFIRDEMGLTVASLRILTSSHHVGALMQVVVTKLGPRQKGCFPYMDAEWEDPVGT